MEGSIFGNTKVFHEVINTGARVYYKHFFEGVLDLLTLRLEFEVSGTSFAKKLDARFPWNLYI